ncbi:hypothetical protein SAMN05443575_1283 [Jatrophihabitans endophyticus]|uniref:CDP-Glycerol:Poly(Glycerophosphate) glycerophosphotransferase n=1 Tax=Jatrophihabitans endophyticus TaxID=1206085 RepID=A0A1M5GT15_9ACTN|nr:hypothetical protein [Jatrophihabitans endophyticus]SHG06859.1 hypothetical protein SAMN05443575_1283 [Jatrophihabitans endophyticus]
MTIPADPTPSHRSITTVEPVPSAGSPLRAGLVFLALIVAVGFTSGAALAGGEPQFVLAVALWVAVEAVSARFTPFINWGLRRVGVGAVARGLLVSATVVVFAVQTNKVPMVVAALLTVLVALAAAMGRSAAAQAIDYLRRPPLLTRGLDLDLPPVPAALPIRVLRQHGVEQIAALPAAIGLALASGRRGDDTWGYAGLSVYLVASLILPTIVVAHAVRLRRLDPRRRVADAAVRRLAEIDPHVVLYYGDGPAWQYQVEVWLTALEDSRRPVLLVVRDRAVLQTLPPTTLPIVCVPASRELMRLPLDSLRAALFVGNTSNNLHMLRRPGVTSVFLGHGDSDKDASRNPFSRAYNEIWVAGPAGRERYRAARVGVSEHAFREIGRPQLESLAREPDTVPMLTVLYAPTWEGWGESPNHSSLAEHGVALVAELLRRPGVRVMYRPHPRTGHIRTTMRRAHQEVVALLREAGAAAPLPPQDSPPAGGTDGRPDPLDVCTRRLPPVGPAGPGAPTSGAAARAERARQFWADRPGHRILTGAEPDLYAAFRVADALVADVSSVVTDFLAADRPYAVVNNTEQSDDDFRANVPAAAGGFLIGRDLTGLDELLAAATDARDDPTAAARARARRYLLGASGAEAQRRFCDELDRVTGTSPARVRPA